MRAGSERREGKGMGGMGVKVFVVCLMGAGRGVLSDIRYHTSLCRK